MSSSVANNLPSMRGLVMFITELRNCRTREAEEKRIQKEMGNIRSKFKDGNLDGYQKKKYVCKLLYMYMLGWEIDFGHLEAISLVSSTKYSEKQIGYLAITLLLTENHDLLRLVINSIRKDLEDKINEVNNCLALQAIANIAGKDLAEALAQDVFKLIVTSGKGAFVKKKATLCLLRMFRKHPDSIQIGEWASSLISLLDDPDMGVVACATSLITTLSQSHAEDFKAAVSKSIWRLHKIILDKECSSDVMYYKVACPWVQVKLMRLLQYFPPPEDAGLLGRLLTVVETVVENTNTFDSAKNTNQSNATNAIRFEAIGLALHLDADSILVEKAATTLGEFLTSKDTNVRFLALEVLTHVACVRESLQVIHKFQSQIIEALKDKDISVRRQALDLLYSMCDMSNSRLIVQELLDYLVNADFDFREDLVLKIAILAEKFATEYSWYIDVMIKLITTAGDQVSKEVWFRVVQIVVNHEELHVYATRAIFHNLHAVACHESVVQVAAYLLGEYGHLIVEDHDASPMEQFHLLSSNYGTVSTATKAQLLTSYMKLVNLFPEIKTNVMMTLERNTNVLDVEIQQRACEYLAILAMDSDDVLQTVCDEIPPFPSDRESVLVSRLNKKEEDTEDKRIWKAGDRSRKPSNASSVSAKGVAPNSPHVDLLGLDTITEMNVSFSLPLVSTVSPNADKWFYKLVTTNDGILYENEALQLGLKSMYSGSNGKLAFYYGNKSSTDMVGVQFRWFPPELTNIFSVEYPQPTLASQISAKNQIMQPVIVKLLTVSSILDGQSLFFQLLTNSTELILRLPITINKFMEPINGFSAQDFFSRWKNISDPKKESQNAVSWGSSVWSPELFRKMLQGCNIGILDGIDPNSNNFVGASVLAENEGKIGCLLRMEPVYEQKVVRVTVRSTNEIASVALGNLLKMLITNGQ